MVYAQNMIFNTPISSQEQVNQKNKIKIKYDKVRDKKVYFIKGSILNLKNVVDYFGKNIRPDFKIVNDDAGFYF